MESYANATWAAVVFAVIGLVAAIIKWRTDTRKEKKNELDAIDSQRLDTCDPSLAALRRTRWWMRNRKS